jgi:hypothetical protein
MLAFWLLATVAAVITGVGLSAGTSEIQVRASFPEPVSRSGSPELLLGGVLRTQPTASRPATGTMTDLLGFATPGGSTSTTAAPSPGQAASRGPGASSGATGGQVVSIPTNASAVAKAHAAAKGRGSGKQQPGTARTSSTATATATTTAKARPTKGPDKARPTSESTRAPGKRTGR